MSTITYEHDKKQQARVTQEILDHLATLGGKLYDDDDVTYEGTKFVLPVGTTLDTAIRFLERKRDEMEKTTVFTRQYDYRPMDGAYCMWNAMKTTFGAVGHRGTMGFFGPNPPEMRTINTGVNQKEQIPWGRFDLPFLPGALFETSEYWHPDLGPLFQITCTAPKKYKFEVNGVFALIEDELAKRSMYRGKAFDGQVVPDFIDVNAVDSEKVIYSEEVMAQLGANVWMQLRHTAQCEEMNIPLKRAVLLHGPYGTGKTLAAMLTGQEAVENGWTFIKARPGRDDISTVLQTARLYEPAVVFYEDVDEIADPAGTPHGGAISRLLDDFDGIEAKGTKILMVLTTNHVDRIHKGMARPGRLDAMIEINELDQQGVMRLVQSRIPEDKLSDGIDWAMVFEAAAEYKPAFVTEFADRTVRYIMDRNDGQVTNVLIETEDLVRAATGLRPQFNVMVGAKDRIERDPLTTAVQSAVAPVAEAAADRAVRRQVADKFLVDPDEAKKDAERAEPLA